MGFGICLNQRKSEKKFVAKKSFEVSLSLVEGRSESESIVERLFIEAAFHQIYSRGGFS
jgi:hypothetical protein